MKLSARQSKNAFYTKREYNASNFIPFDSHWDRETIITKNNELISVIKLEGFFHETADDEDVDQKKHIRNNLLRSVDSSKYSFWFHTIREKKSVDIDGEFKEGFANDINEAWRDRYKRNKTFVNNLYISIVLVPEKQGTANKVNRIISFTQKKISKSAEKIELFERSRELKEIVNRFLGSLQQYRPKLLSIKETKTGVFSEILEFFGKLVNCGNTQNYLVPSRDISSYLPISRLYFSSYAKVIECRDINGKSKYAAMLTIKKYSQNTFAGMLDAFLQMPFCYVISQVYIASEKQKIISKLSLQQGRLSSVKDKAISQTMELTQAMDMAQGGSISFGNHFFTIMVFEEDLELLEGYINMCYGEMINLGITPVREGLSLQGSYWSQLPGNFDYISRKSLINSLNVASLCSFHNYPTGSAKNNHWGPAVTLLETTSGTPYFFNFHVRDIGHSVIIGPTGTGKTVLMNFLCAQSRKFGGKMFFFDKDRGAEIFIRAIGGVHTQIEPRQKCGLNPLQLDDTSRNRSFLVEWIAAMVEATGGEQKLTSDDYEKIDDAVNGCFRMPKEERKLENIVPFLGFDTPGSLPSRLKMWYGNGAYAGLFNNDEDSLDLNKFDIYGFDMTEVLYDKISLTPVLLYLFHKINISLDGSPTVIVLDEAWAMIDNEMFAPKIKNWLKVLRKLNAMVIFATQSVEDLSGSAINDTLIQQTATQIFLANNKATEEYMKSFMLTHREYSLIRTMDPSSRFFLLKQDEETVVARIDLRGLDDIINVLSGRAETVGLLDEIVKKVGDDPQKWLPVFQKKSKEMQKREEMKKKENEI